MFQVIRKGVVDLTRKVPSQTYHNYIRVCTVPLHRTQQILSVESSQISKYQADYNYLLTRTLCLFPHLHQKATDSSSQPKGSSSDISPSKDPSQQIPESKEDTAVVEESIGIFKRFKLAYKEHGKVLIGVHLLTSSVWFGTFYYAAASGLDVAPLLEMVGVSQKVIDYVHSSVGNIATAYLIYKLATPARYTVTVFGTYSSVKYLRKWGYMEAPKESESIRSLMKDGRAQMKERYVDLKDDVKDRIEKHRDDREKKKS